MLTLNGCYTLDQEKFDAYASQTVKAGMPLAEAGARLVAEGFACDRKSFAPTVSCSRQRGPLWPPYSCIERINLVPAGAIVGKVEVPPIICASL